MARLGALSPRTSRPWIISANYFVLEHERYCLSHIPVDALRNYRCWYLWLLCRHVLRMKNIHFRVSLSLTYHASTGCLDLDHLLLPRDFWNVSGRSADSFHRRIWDP
jgi:hypothetical protein